jgi:hypothetical protein
MNRTWVIGWIAMILLVGCGAEQNAPNEDLFPPQVGEFLRTSGPGPDPVSGVDQSIYEGASGIVILRIKQVGEEKVQAALAELPPTATSIGYDPALGQRNGQFFLFNQEFHAAWGNGDWVFVLSSSTEAARLVFLSAYGY